VSHAPKKVLKSPLEEQDFLPFSRPTIDEGAIEEVVSCLRSGWITTGPRVQQFESDLMAYVKAPHAIAVSSGTGALYMVLKALGLSEGDEVITTPFTFIATLNAIELAGAKPVLVDIDPKTYNLDLQQVEKAITDKTRVILPVHFAGLPVDLDPLYALANKKNLVVLEDAAHAIGTQYKGRPIGSFGHVQIFSFHPNKTMTTGEGGAITFHDEVHKKTMVGQKFHGIMQDAWDRFTKKGSQAYDVAFPAFKFNMMDIQAAIGIHQLKSLDSFIEKRTKLAHAYLEAMGNWEEFTFTQKPAFDCKHSWHLFAPLINPEKAGMDRDTFMAKMKEHNIGTGLHYQPAHLFSYYKNKYGYKCGSFPQTEDVASRIVSLPLFPLITSDDQKRVVSTIAKIFGKKA
jgi:dTDP-4-amino-4,6-dideoxygalactose transaminase